MREHLLGYLLKALEPDETKMVEGSLDRDAQLRAQVESLRHCLDPLSADAGHLTPPDGLALRTCRYVAAHAESTTVRAASSGSRNWRLADLVVAAGVLIAASMVFFPAVSHSRFNAHLASCQYNLRSIGQGALAYSQYHGGFFPLLQTSGNRAVAGYYAPLLRQAGYIDNDATLVCPGSRLGRVGNFRTPTDREIELTVGQDLVEMQGAMGGSYGYNLGVQVNGRYQGIQNQARSTFALFSDAPRPQSLRSQGNSENHGGIGQNVLFEDGHVRFLRSCRQCDFSDDYFHNAAGDVAAGVHVDDAVIGHSATPPLGWPSER